MRALLPILMAFSVIVPAQAWQFDLRNDRGAYYGVIWSYDVRSEAVLSATCWPGEKAISVRLDALAPRFPVREDGVAFFDGGGLASVPYQAQRAPSISILPMDGRSGEAVLNGIASARSEIDVSWQGMVARFDASDARAAVTGFNRMCAMLPRWLPTWQ